MLFSNFQISKLIFSAHNHRAYIFSFHKFYFLNNYINLTAIINDVYLTNIYLFKKVFYFMNRFLVPNFQ